MSKKHERQAKKWGPAAGVIASTQPAPTTTTAYQELAKQFSAAFDKLAASVPDLEGSHALTEKFVRGHQNLRREFFEAVITAVDEHPELQAVQKLDADDARNRLQFIEAFQPVLDKVETFVKALRFTVSTRKATLAVDTLQMYAIAKGLARDAGSAPMQASVGIIRRNLGSRGNPGRRKPQETTAQAA